MSRTWEAMTWDEYREMVKQALDADEQLNHGEDGIRLREPLPVPVDPRDLYYMLQAVDKAHDDASTDVS